MISRVSSASRFSLNSINRLVNIELQTLDFGKELTALQGSVFAFILFISILFYGDV
jgi:hypothetical protein